MALSTPDLTIIVPTIRADSLPTLLDSIPDSIGYYTYELIIIGPNKMEEYEGLTYIEDYGSPSRCVQRAACQAKGTLMTWLTDDRVCKANALAECIETLLAAPKEDGIIVRYTEEGPYSELNGSTKDYYISWKHRDNQLIGIPTHYLIAPVPMYYTETFQALGGIDCRFEHVNMNIHDLAYRVQNAGGKLHYSPSVVMHCNSNNFGADHAVLDRSYSTNDLPLFRELYNHTGPVRQVLDMNNWERSPAKWRRFN